MSKKDGKATLLKSIEKKGVFILPLSNALSDETVNVLKACPVKVIKIQ
jgi:hypothetical protein